MTRGGAGMSVALPLALVAIALSILVADGTSAPIADAAPQVDQTTSSPSPSASDSASSSTSASPSPSPTGLKDIQFLNPSANSTIVSAKPDGTNSTYHLVAVARQQGLVDPIVEFKYQQGAANEVTIAVARRIGTTDAFETFWDLGTLADGTYTLRATLYDGSVRLGEDEINVTLNNADSLQSPQAETIEIVYPSNGEGAGFYKDPASDSLQTIVQVTSSAAIAPPSTSTGTANISVSYTTTPPGLEPVWTQCATGTRAATGSNSFHCALAAKVSPDDVTGLAARAQPTATQVAPGSGDGHRVFGYSQRPTSFSASPVDQTKPANACSDVIVATLLDQQGRKIAGVNVDVHAKGPVDGLKFDNPGGNSSAHKPPDEAHSGEGTRVCEGAGSNSSMELQGDHDYINEGNADVKHIEAEAAGTDDNGQLTFQLYTQVEGRTDWAVFADTDDDDLWCADEVSARGSITWTQPATPVPSPSSSGSSSSSATASPSGSEPEPEPEPTTLDPELDECRSPSPSGSGSEAPPERTISVNTSKSRVTYGKPIKVSGRIEASENGCVSDQKVQILRRVHGRETFKLFKATRSNEDGTFGIKAVVLKSADYQAKVEDQGDCDETTSSVATTLAKAAVSAALSDASPSRGATVTIAGNVRPNHRGKTIVLHRRKGTKWVRVAPTKLSERSRYVFRIKAMFDERIFRVRFPKQDQDHAAGTSRRLQMRTAS